MQYAAEMFFTNFAGYIKLILFLSIPFLLTKRNIDIAYNKILAIKQKAIK